jgi:small-conductance mechanosensitive channel
MDGLLALYKHFSRIPLEQLPGVALQMLPGALLGIGFAFVVLFLREFVGGRLNARAERVHTYPTLTVWSKRIVESLKGWFVWLAGVQIAVQTMPYMTAVDGPMRRLFMLGAFVQLGLIAVHALSEWNRETARELRAKEPARVAMMASMVRVGYVFIWLVVFILLLNNYGVNVSALVAGLGVGGIAVAFALQNVLKDIFSSFSIVFDKPFVVGDFIIAGDFMGTVEEIGIKTTRIRSLSGEQIVISNGDLLESRIRNYRTLGERRVVFSIKVGYETTAEQLAKIPAMITKLLQQHDDVRVDRVHLQSLTDFGPLFETVYFVAVPDYNRMMDINQAVYIGLFKAFAKEGIRFAVPVQRNVGELAAHQRVGRKKA